MKHLLILFITIILLYTATTAGTTTNSAIVLSTPKKELKKQEKTKKCKKLMRGEKRRGIALLLCLFLGWFAVHRWYLGTSDRSRFWLSILYLLLSFFLYIHVILDFFSILFGKMDFYLDNPGIFIWVTALF